MQRFETQVSFECPACGTNVSAAVEVPQPDWSAAENDSDLNSDGITEVTCSKCRAEFPAIVSNRAGSCEIVLDDHPAVHIACDVASFSPEVEEDWLELETKGDPYTVFDASYRQAAQVLEEHGDESGSHLINRMVFAQQVSALEAYLGDTLMRIVETERDAVQRLIEKDKDLLSEKVTLAEIAKNPNLVRDRVMSYLRGVLYHNLTRVDFLYRTAFDVGILGTKDENAHLLQAIKLRHDCVHRNGMDQEGRRLSVFTPVYVQQTADRMKALVDRVQADLFVEPVPWEEPSYRRRNAHVDIDDIAWE